MGAYALKGPLAGPCFRQVPLQEAIEKRADGGLPQQLFHQDFWRSTQRKPRWQVVLSIGWAMRAAGR